MIITDNMQSYIWPDNVRKLYMSFAQMRQRIQKKFSMQISLEYPYKLCDFKPTYGYVFEEECREYRYWGHCDCDLIFGNLNKILAPLLDQGYDKLFAAGHLTIYRNTWENTRRFFHECRGVQYYKKALTTDEICWFDEDLFEQNIHTIFLDEGAKLYTRDLSLNVAVDYPKFLFAPYVDEISKFKVQPFRRALYVWNNGELEKTECDADGRLRTESYLYMHFQLRHMRYRKRLEEVIQIYPNGFRAMKQYPVTVKQWKRLTGMSPNLHYLRRKWSNLKKRLERWNRKKA